MKRLLRHRNIFIIYLLAAVAVSIQMVLRGAAHSFIPGEKVYTYYNNYVIFKQSFFNLINGNNLYILYPDKHWDLYKYSPAFALFMGLFAPLPDVAGLSLWNMLNAAVLFYAIRLLPLAERQRSYILLFVFIELITSLQNAQSNGLLAGSIILADSLLRRGKPQWAALWLVIGTFIKIYGAVGFILFLFYPGKLKFILSSVLWTAFFLLVPLVVTSPATLLSQYTSWLRMMGEDHSASYGFSVMGWLQAWFGLGSLKNKVMLTGVLLFFLPLLRKKLWRDQLWQLLFLAHMLIWVVIFNHKAESPTYIIAVAGVAVWYFSRPPAAWRTILLSIVFVVTCLTPTDIFPPAFRKEVLVPYVVKAVPVITLWIFIMVEIMRMKKNASPDETKYKII
jgi:hypothetical protein